MGVDNQQCGRLRTRLYKTSFNASGQRFQSVAPMRGGEGKAKVCRSACRAAKEWAARGRPEPLPVRNIGGSKHFRRTLSKCDTRSSSYLFPLLHHFTASPKSEHRIIKWLMFLVSIAVNNFVALPCSGTHKLRPLTEATKQGGWQVTCQHGVNAAEFAILCEPL